MCWFWLVYCFLGFFWGHSVTHVSQKEVCKPLNLLAWWCCRHLVLTLFLLFILLKTSRQKQYFEQRRQQQHQLTAAPEGCDNDRNNSNQHPREHQSLDILNLLNLSTATPECKPCYPKDGNIYLLRLPVIVLSVGYSFRHYSSQFMDSLFALSLRIMTLCFLVVCVTC